MPVADASCREVAEVAANPEHPKSNRELAIELRAQGLSTPEIGRRLGMSHQGVQKLLKTANPSSLPVARLEAASRTLAELAEATRADLAETFRLGASRASRRIREVHASSDDAAAKTVLETAKLATEGAARVHGWGETNASGSGRVSIGLITDLRGLKSAQVVDLTPVVEEKTGGDDCHNHQQDQKGQQNEANPL